MKKAAIAIINTPTNNFISISRINNHNDFGFIGGSVDDGETPEEAICREVFEETGLTLTNPILISIDILNDTELYCYTFKTIDLRGLKFGLGEEGIVALKSEPELSNPINTYYDFNKKLIQKYLFKFHLTNKHSYIFPMKIENYVYYVQSSVDEDSVKLGDTIIVIDSLEAVIIRINNNENVEATNYLNSKGFTTKTLLDRCFKVIETNNPNIQKENNVINENESLLTFQINLKYTFI